MKTAHVTVKGITPCIMHNGQTASPLNKFAKLMKEVSGKRKKTDEDYEAMARIELEAAFYVDSQGRPCWPGENIEGGFCEASRKLKLGKVAKAAVICDGLWPIIHSGPKGYREIMDDPNYVDCRSVRIQSSRVMRTRPIFRDWALKFDLHFNEELLNPADIRQILDIFGDQVGLSDFRPKFGRFLVQDVTFTG